MIQLQRIGRAVLTATLALGAASCATNPSSRSAAQPASRDATILDVSNHNWSDMVIYALQSNQRQRLGTVGSMSRIRIDLPRTLQSTGSKLQLLADPIGGRGQFRTDPIRIGPGQRVELTLENNLAISNYSISYR